MPLLQDPYKPGDLLRRAGGWDGDTHGIRHPRPAHKLQRQILPEDGVWEMSSGKDIGGEVCVNYENLTASFVGLSVWIRVIHRPRSSAAGNAQRLTREQSKEFVMTIGCGAGSIMVLSAASTSAVNVAGTLKWQRRDRRPRYE